MPRSVDYSKCYAHIQISSANQDYHKLVLIVPSKAEFKDGREARAAINHLCRQKGLTIQQETVDGHARFYVPLNDDSGLSCVSLIFKTNTGDRPEKWDEIKTYIQEMKLSNDRKRSHSGAQAAHASSASASSVLAAVDPAITSSSKRARVTSALSVSPVVNEINSIDKIAQSLRDIAEQLLLLNEKLGPMEFRTCIAFADTLRRTANMLDSRVCDIISQYRVDVYVSVPLRANFFTEPESALNKALELADRVVKGGPSDVFKTSVVPLFDQVKIQQRALAEKISSSHVDVSPEQSDSLPWDVLDDIKGCALAAGATGASAAP